MSLADLVIQNGPVITMDSNRRIVEAIAVIDGKIIAVGIKPEVKRLIGPMTEELILMVGLVHPVWLTLTTTF
jgi:predicted amidohydrolase YtcJ